MVSRCPRILDFRRVYLQCSEVDDRVNVRVLLEDIVKRLLVCHIELRELGTLATDEFDTIEDLVGGVVQVVRNHYFVASF